MNGAILPNLQMPLAWLIDLEYMPGWKAALLFLALAAPIVGLGMRSLAGLGAVRKWVAIALRLAVLAVLVLILGGARWERRHKNLELLVMRDISDSTTLVGGYPGKNLTDSVDDYLRSASDVKYKPSREDRIGVISFSNHPLIDSMPNTSLILDARAIRERGESTDIAAAIQLGLATFDRDSMRRLLLISDGNMTQGDLDTALAAAVSQHVPIDVMPLHFAVQNEVLVAGITSPDWKRENDAFDIPVSLVSTNREEVTGTLRVTEAGLPLAERKITLEPATINADGLLQPRKHVERIHVPALKKSGALRFAAVFEPDVVNPRDAAPEKARAGDTLLGNNTGSSVTFVEGKSRVLYVDNTKDGAGDTLYRGLLNEQVNVERIGIDQVPEDIVRLQNYDAIILNNVPRGRTPEGGDGVSEATVVALAAYVHEFGGGLIMIGGPDSFGAGGWQGSKVEEVMPVNFDIPAQRQLPKGALVLVIHSCEIPEGNYWGEQCALKAVETLSSQDEVGVISYDGMGAANGGVGGSSWNYPLSQKGDGGRVTSAIKRMHPGDMPSFDDCLKLAIQGAGGANDPCLLRSNAAQKHIIIISDGDPAAPAASLIKAALAAKISISTISVNPHSPTVPPTMQDIANQTKGRYYGPIDKNHLGQLPQIFIKEATVVRRTLLQESKEPPIAVTLLPNNSDIMKGLPDQWPSIEGMVLSQKKNNPTVEMPLVASVDMKKVDPLFAHWQAGLGKAAAFASDAGARWDQRWLTPQFSAAYSKFWSQMVRAMSRPPMSTDFSITTERNGDKATITVEATNKSAGFTNFLSIDGKVMGPDGELHDVRLVQTGPGTYTGQYDASKPGDYIVRLAYSGQDAKTGWLVSGLVVNDSPEMRELKSNDLLLEQIAKQTGGRVLPAFDPQSADIFSRQNIPPSASPLPVWDILVPILLGLILIDVAARRIAWDWNSTKKMAAATAAYVRSFTLTRQVEAAPTLDALKRVREEVAEAKFKPAEDAGAVAAPDRRAKFEAAKAVDGDITSVVGGATAKPIPSAPKEAQPKGATPGGHTGSLLEAKRRAQKIIKERQEGEN